VQENFYDIPSYEVSGQEERTLLEIALLRQAFNQVEYDSEKLLWVCIHDFQLPKGFNKDTSGLLIELPKNYPFSPPINCFLDRSIRTSDGRSIRDHYFPDRSYNKYYDKGWAWFCFHIKNWKLREDIIQSDNLLTCVDIAYLTLENLLKDAR
jgi:hypothetical protein